MRKLAFIRVTNEKVVEDIILIEKEEYRCRARNNLISLYREFDNK
jgi:hypothetical protein